MVWLGLIDIMHHELWSCIKPRTTADLKTMGVMDCESEVDSYFEAQLIHILQKFSFAWTQLMLSQYHPMCCKFGGVGLGGESCNHCNQQVTGKVWLTNYIYITFHFSRVPTFQARVPLSSSPICSTSSAKPVVIPFHLSNLANPQDYRLRFRFSFETGN